MDKINKDIKEIGELTVINEEEEVVNKRSVNSNANYLKKKETIDILESDSEDEENNNKQKGQKKRKENYTNTINYNNNYCENIISLNISLKERLLKEYNTTKKKVKKYLEEKIIDDNLCQKIVKCLEMNNHFDNIKFSHVLSDAELSKSSIGSYSLDNRIINGPLLIIDLTMQLLNKLKLLENKESTTLANIIYLITAKKGLIQLLENSLSVMKGEIDSVSINNF